MTTGHLAILETREENSALYDLIKAAPEWVKYPSKLIGLLTGENYVLDHATLFIN